MNIIRYYKRLFSQENIDRRAICPMARNTTKTKRRTKETAGSPRRKINPTGISTYRRDVLVEISFESYFTTSVEKLFHICDKAFPYMW